MPALTPRRAALLTLLPLLLSAAAFPAHAQDSTIPATPLPATPPEPALPAAQPPLPGSSIRGLWVDAFGPGLKTRAQVRQMVQDAASMGINTLFVQAIRRGDCLCLKSGLPLITDADLEKNFDPLAVTTREAHARGLRVIAWVSTTGAFNTNAPNTNAQHVFRTHGPTSGAQSWLARRPDGSWQEGRDGWLDVGIPAAAEFITQAVVNLVRHYPVDGVQLDRIRYPDGAVWGYDPKVLSRYRTETGRTGTPSTDDPQWNEWKRQQVTALVRRITLEVKAVRPETWVSAATIVYLQPPLIGDSNGFRKTRTYWDVLQDWPTWVREGLIDLNVLMNYKRDGLDNQASWFDGWNAFARSVSTRTDDQRAALAAGTAMYLNDPQVTAAQVSRATQAGLGWVGYSYRTPTASVYSQQQSGAQGLQAVQALLSAPDAPLSGSTQPWRETPPTVRGLLGRITGTPNPGYRVVEASQRGQVVAQTLTDGSGYYGFAALPAGQTEIRVSGQRWLDTIPARGVVRLPDLFVRDLQPVR